MPYFVNFDPVAFSIGPLSVHWYGVMYLLGFAVFWKLGTMRASEPRYGWTAEEVSDILFYGALGVVLGGRVGYILFYDLQYVIQDPHRIYQIWKGGMSFHGGLLGVLLAFVWFAHKTGRSFSQVADFIAPLVPPGLFFGRIGNFIGGELWGRVSDVPWAMIFPKALDPRNWDSPDLLALYQSGALNDQARHPSQLYEAALEGLVLFVLLWWYSGKPRPRMAVSGLFLLGYGLFRGFVESFRQPDEHIGFLAGEWLTMGVLLSVPLVLVGLAMMVIAHRRGFTD
jgi:phosphatidylglycerol:prolipoprotein diacylglycerol transferase